MRDMATRARMADESRREIEDRATVDKPAAVPETDRVIATVGKYIGLDADQVSRLAGCLDLLRLKLVPAASPIAGVSARIDGLVAAAREINNLSLMICSPQAWLNEHERDRIVKAILQLRAALDLLAQPSAEGDGWIADMPSSSLPSSDAVIAALGNSEYARNHIKYGLQFLTDDQKRTLFRAVLQVFHRDRLPAPVAKEGRES